MQFRELGNGRTVRRPSIDPDELVAEAADFAGEFDVDLARVTGDSAGAAGRGSVTDSMLEQVDLADARLGPLTVSDAVLTAVDLSNAAVTRLTARTVELVRCRAIGLRASFELAADLYAEDCQFDYATIDFDRVRGTVAFVGCSFKDATISGDLSSVLFDGCDLTGAQFEATRAKDCDLRTSRLADARGLARLHGALITTEQAVSIAVQLAAEVGLSVRD
ncbi:pentapeptide repeat-containing protein [Solihabitans fulvus]|uniref:Pentapeptide repeat-containing protein n=1 Tax=Solihabitans fulvus TaxID=1892852 RepID=A0A5B2WJK4_9PSEU|nr:pentapeptide repeat-containing protein [Solihabitans fulvus]KAA2250940.1 pentapeptide repeat-containing protein [Solihabitans fulvus]